MSVKAPHIEKLSPSQEHEWMWAKWVSSPHSLLMITVEDTHQHLQCLWARLHPTTAQRNTLLIKVKRTHQHQTGHSWLKMPPQKINWIDKKYCVKKRGWVCLPSREIGRRDRRLASTCCPPLWFKNGGVFKHRSFLLKRTQAGLCLQGSVMGEFTLASLRT